MLRVDLTTSEPRPMEGKVACIAIWGDWAGVEREDGLW